MLISPIALKGILATLKSAAEAWFTASVNIRVTLTIREGFIFANLHIREVSRKKTLVKIINIIYTADGMLWFVSKYPNSQ